MVRKLTHADVSRTKETFVSVYQSVGGWKAVVLGWDAELDTFVPEQTGFSGFVEKEDAVRDAESWARSEGLPLVI